MTSRFDEALATVLADGIDLGRMATCLTRRRRRYLARMDDAPADALVNRLIKHFLYGDVREHSRETKRASNLTFKPRFRANLRVIQAPPPSRRKLQRRPRPIERGITIPRIEPTDRPRAPAPLSSLSRRHFTRRRRRSRPQRVGSPRDESASLAARTETVARLNRLATHDAAFWSELLSTTITAPSAAGARAVVLGSPSAAKAKSMAEEEEARTKAQAEALGAEALKARAATLEAAVAVNERDLPEDALKIVPIPDATKVRQGARARQIVELRISLESSETRKKHTRR